MVAILAWPGKIMLDFDNAKIVGALAGRETRLAVAFSTACAQRLVNSFDRLEEYEEAKSIAQTTLRALKSYLFDGEVLPEGLENQLVSFIPGEDDDPSLPAGTLDDALAALAFSVRASTTSPIESACNAAARALATSFRYSLQFLNETLLTDSSLRFAMENRIVQCELQRQERDLADIGDGSQQMKAIVRRLINRFPAEAVLEKNV